MNEKKLSSTDVFKGKVISLRVDKILSDNGKTAEREVISHNGGAAIVAARGGKILLEKQFRYPYGEVIWEIPAGKREKNEEFIETAKRELEEETGLIPLNLRSVFNVYPSPGYTDEVIAIFYADEFQSGVRHLDETEDISAVWLDEEEVYSMIEKGEIKDAKTLIGVLWYKNTKNERS